MDLPRDDWSKDPYVRDMDMEVYSITRSASSGHHQTMFIFELPDAVLKDMSDPARRQRLLDVPQRIHTNLLETALAKWAEQYNKIAGDIVTGVGITLLTLSGS